MTDDAFPLSFGLLITEWDGVLGRNPQIPVQDSLLALTLKREVCTTASAQVWGGWSCSTYSNVNTILNRETARLSRLFCRWIPYRKENVWGHLLASTSISTTSISALHHRLLAPGAAFLVVLFAWLAAMFSFKHNLVGVMNSSTANW